MPGSASGRVTVANTARRTGAERAGRRLEPPVDRLDREPDRPHHHRKGHDRAAITAPVQRNNNDDAEPALEQLAERTAPPEQDQQDIAGHHRRQDQRQMHQGIEQLLAPELAAGQQPSDRDRERQADDQVPRGYPKGEP